MDLQEGFEHHHAEPEVDTVFQEMVSISTVLANKSVLYK